MFRSSKKPVPGPPQELLDRAKALTSKPPPASYEDAPRNKRAPRSKVFRQAIATLEGGEVLPIAIKNLSTSGCRIEYFRNTPLTDRLTIHEQTLSMHFEAEVVWQGDGAAGLRFLGADDADRS